MEYLDNIGKAVKSAGIQLNRLSEKEIDNALISVSECIYNSVDFIMFENKKDIEVSKQKGISEALIDRLYLDEKRIHSMASGLKDISALTSPIGETIYSYINKSGLKIEQKRVPFGVVGIIYESRPNVTSDAFGLCFKTKNAVILRGGSDAINSNKAIVQCIKKGLSLVNINEDSIMLIEDLSRETARKFMKLKDYVDLLIPRGGAGLIKSVVENSTIPIIETGTGNCHIYVDEFANIEMAIEIIYNAKTQRYGVCNACESLVVHNKIADMFLPQLKRKLALKNVEIRGDARSRCICNDFQKSNEEDFRTEYLAPIISVKMVDSIEEAIIHINANSTGHSEAIITENKDNAEKFMNEIDSSTVYHNASTRFTDGFEFGFGAEIGISTQKLHARGAMGLKALTTTKFYCYGNGQIRE